MANDTRERTDQPLTDATVGAATTDFLIEGDPFERQEPDQTAREREPNVHVYGRKGARRVCRTDTRGFPQPQGRSPLEIVVDASGGFVPLWAPNSTLRYRFQRRSMAQFRNPEAAKAAIRRLLGDALMEWGDAAPVRFAERNDAWDFEIVVRNADDCDLNGCVLASAFFPDQGRHELVIYPKMFQQSRREQVETLIHEVGHIYGLRHFFALVQESAWPAHVFGTHDRFTIMNYGGDSVLTDADRNDLKALYAKVWSGEISNINGTPIRLMKPFSANRP
jgi:hypothetical protein